MKQIKRINSGTRASQVVIADHHFETSGIVSDCGNKHIIEQTHCVLAQLEQLLHLAGTDKHHITRIQIWLADMTHFQEMNQVYDAWVSTIEKPARACVGAQLADPNYLIEIQANGTL